jgi:four helix bundle protein
MARTRHFRDLLAWQKAMDLARDVYARTEEFPTSELFGLRLQMRRCAVSVASNIAEGHGRLTDAQFRNFLGMARGSLYELETQLELACNLGFVDQDSAQTLQAVTTETAKLINGLIGALRTE